MAPQSGVRLPTRPVLEPAAVLVAAGFGHGGNLSQGVTRATVAADLEHGGLRFKLSSVPAIGARSRGAICLARGVAE
jgi:hypothetical protein